VRRLWRRVFQISQDEDFINHISVTREEVRDFIEGGGDGPNPDELRFDLAAQHDSPWNQDVISILVEKHEELRLNQLEPLRLAERPVKYVEKLMIEKFRRCKSHWASAQPRMVGGIEETGDEVGCRVEYKKNEDLKRSRHASRRLRVSGIFYWKVVALSYNRNLTVVCEY
jgi:hypothetical protein